MTRAIAPNPPLAVGLMLTACLFIAGSTLMAKLAGTDTLGDPLHPLQVSHGRFLFAWMLVASLAVVMRLKIRQPDLKLHALRTVSGWGGVSLMFAAVAFIPMADATAISFLNPVFAMMLAIPLLKETVGPVRWAAAGIALIGALVLLRPTPASFQPAALLALAAAMAMGLEITLIKLLSGRESPLQILFINNSLGLIIASLAVIPFWTMPSGPQWAALVGVGILMALAQMAYVNAMARAEASFVVPFAYATLIFAAIFDALVFTRLPDAITLLGAAIIIAGAALLAWREARAARLNRKKERFAWNPPAAPPGDPSITTLDGVRDWMDQNGYHRNSIDIGVSPYDGHVMRATETGFEWLYTERGNEQIETTFTSEADAAQFALAQLRANVTARQHCIGFTRSKRLRDTLIAELDSRGIPWWSDTIPYGGPRDPRHRVYVWGNDAQRCADLSRRYVENPR